MEDKLDYDELHREIEERNEKMRKLEIEFVVKSFYQKMYFLGLDCEEALMEVIKGFTKGPTGWER